MAQPGSNDVKISAGLQQVYCRRVPNAMCGQAFAGEAFVSLARQVHVLRHDPANTKSRQVATALIDEYKRLITWQRPPPMLA